MAAAKTGEKKTTTAKTAAAKKTTTAKTAAAARKSTVPAGANTSMKVTATEKKLVEVYRNANANLKKIALKVLKGEYSDTSLTLLDAVGGGLSSGVDSLGEGLGNLIGNLFGGKK